MMGPGFIWSYHTLVFTGVICFSFLWITIFWFISFMWILFYDSSGYDFWDERKGGIWAGYGRMICAREAKSERKPSKEGCMILWIKWN